MKKYKCLIKTLSKYLIIISSIVLYNNNLMNITWWMEFCVLFLSQWGVAAMFCGTQKDIKFKFKFKRVYCLWSTMWILTEPPEWGTLTGGSYCWSYILVSYLVINSLAANRLIFHDAPVPYTTTHHFVTERCTCTRAHFSYKMMHCGTVVKCIVGFMR